MFLLNILVQICVTIRQRISDKWVSTRLGKRTFLNLCMLTNHDHAGREMEDLHNLSLHIFQLSQNNVDLSE